MENYESILEATNIDSSGQNLLLSSGNWAKFIGIVYLSISGLLVTIFILLFLNLEYIANVLMDINVMSAQAIEFMMGAGKLIFTIIALLTFSSCLFNGIFLMKFGKSTRVYSIQLKDDALANSFTYLGRYFMLTTLLSIISTVISILAIGYYLFK